MSTPSPAGHNARQRRKEARPQELLDAALSLFVEKGFAATRSDEVAVRAGVSKGTLYLYYPSKEELLRAVIEQNLSRIITEGSDLAADYQGPTVDLIALLLRTWWQRIGQQPAGGIYKVIVSEVRNFPEIGKFYLEEVIRPGVDLMKTLLRRGIDRGEFRPVNVDHVVHVLFAPLLFMALHKHSLGACPAEGLEVDANEVVEAHIDLLLNGLRLQPGAGAVPMASGLRQGEAAKAAADAPGGTAADTPGDEPGHPNKRRKSTP